MSAQHQEAATPHVGEHAADGEHASEGFDAGATIIEHVTNSSLEHPLVHLEPIAGIDGQPLVRTFGIGALASAEKAHLRTTALPEIGLTFDDQGAPVLTDGTICLQITGAEEDGAFAVLLSTATGRVSITR